MVDTRRIRWSGPALVRLYPATWRSRYEPEMLALLAERPITTREVVDLLRGAADARLHPEVPSAVPSSAAILAGAAWFVYASRDDTIKEARQFAEHVSKKIAVDFDDRYLLTHLNRENQAANLPAWRERLFRSLRSSAR
jgi:hypothetical protein